MATIVQNRQIPGDIRVATVFEAGNIRPVWFETEQAAADRISVTKVNMIWDHHVGSAKLISFAVTATDGNNYTLEFNTEELAWSLSIAETTPPPLK